MRGLFLLLLLAGAALGFGYPWTMRHLTGHDLGILQLYDRASGYHAIDKQLSPDDAPVRVLVDMRVVGGTKQANGQSILTITAISDGRTVLAVPLSFLNASLVDKSPQTNERIYREDAGLISDIKAGTYSFAVQPGDEKGIYIQSVKVLLRARALGVNEMVPMLGFLLMTAGLIGLIFAVRRRRRLQWEGRSLMANRDRNYGN